MIDQQASSIAAALTAMIMPIDDLTPWAFGRTNDDSLRQTIVRLEFDRRVAVAQIETAKATKLSVVFMGLSAVAIAVTAVLQYFAWMQPHVPK